MKFAKFIALLFAVLLWAQVTFMFVVMQWGAVGLGYIIAVVAVFAALLVVPTVYGALSGAPWLPTDDAHVDRMLVVAGVKPGETVVDLGAGDGRFLIAAARAGAKAEGWEINPYLVAVGRWRIARAGLSHLATLRLGSYWPEHMGHADVVTLFLITGQMKKMQEKLRAELKPGSRVVSYVFTFPEWEAKEAGGSIALYVR